MSSERTKRQKTDATQNQTGAVNICCEVDNDTRTLCTIFPEELWKQILANVKTGNDYLKICGASPFFKYRLSFKRIPCLLEGVVQILLCPSDTENGTRFLLRHLVDHRLVCRDWKNGIDQAIQHLPKHYQFTDEVEQLVRQNGLETGFKFMLIREIYVEKFLRTEDFLSFINYFRDSHLPSNSNPFPTRTIELVFPEEVAEYHSFLRDCWIMLKYFGKHVWYLHITGNMTLNLWSTKEDFGNILKHLLGQMPNLRVLRYNIYNVFKFCETTGCQFPLLKKLQFLDTVGLPFGLFEEHVKAQIGTGNITQTGITLHESSDTKAGQKFLAFCKLQLKLTKLRIDFSGSLVWWNIIFSGLETYFGDTLVHLHISLPDKGLFVQDRRLRLPNLKTLRLVLVEPVPLDFLLGVAQTLENFTLSTLKLTIEQFKRVQKQERKIKFFQSAVKFLSTSNNPCIELTNTNIWDRFLKLKKMIVNVNVHSMYFRDRVTCTREEWKASSS